MFVLFQTVPTIPTDITALLNWLILPETLFAFFLIWLKLPFVIDWPDWEKGASYTVIATFVSGIVVALQQTLTPDVVGKVQPFVGPFVIILNLVLGYFGIQAIKKPLTELWETFITSRKLNNEELRLNNKDIEMRRGIHG